jgi:hypothetical protein
MIVTPLAVSIPTPLAVIRLISSKEFSQENRIQPKRIAIIKKKEVWNFFTFISKILHEGKMDHA